MTGKKNTAWLETMIKKHGSREAVLEHQRAIASKGGKKGAADGVIKGFAADPERARRAGKIGGSRSKRKKVL